MDKAPTPLIRALYPHFSEKELAEAEDTLQRYLSLVLRIFERMESQTDSEAAPLATATGTLSSTLPGPKSST